jgi:hypothetical protein
VKRSYVLSSTLAGLALLTSPPLAAQETDTAGAPASTPTTAPATDVAARLQALEQQVADQKRKIDSLEADRAENIAGVAPVEVEQPKLHIYGFADMGWQVVDAKFGAYTAVTTVAPYFTLGNINLYFDAQPSPSWRALVETRYGLFPNGSWNGLTQTNTRFMDTSSPSGRGYAIWSGIVLERAWLQWSLDERFGVQVGYLLTPYGIWNMDHGTPTLISLLLPSSQVEEAIPQHLAGVQAFGTFPIDNWQLAYYAYLTNGRNAFSADAHYTKGVGGRLILRRVGELRVALGSSGYFGSLHKHALMLDLSSGGSLYNSTLAADGGYEGDEWSIGGDISLDWKGLRFRGETMAAHVGYDDGKHEHVAFGNPSALIPNHYSHYAYGILAYRFATYYEPYLFIDYNDTDPQVKANKYGICYSAGLNLYFTSYAMLKMQYAEQRFSATSTGQKMYMRFAAARLVLVF